jgi:hypothetical protein
MPGKPERTIARRKYGKHMSMRATTAGSFVKKGKISS